MSTEVSQLVPEFKYNPATHFQACANTRLNKLFSPNSLYLLYYYGQRENANTLLRGIAWL